LRHGPQMLVAVAAAGYCRKGLVERGGADWACWNILSATVTKTRHGDARGRLRLEHRHLALWDFSGDRLRPAA
jgi:hypothetical protein